MKDGPRFNPENSNILGMLQKEKKQKEPDSKEGSVVFFFLIFFRSSHRGAVVNESD